MADTLDWSPRACVASLLVQRDTPAERLTFDTEANIRAALAMYARTEPAAYAEACAAHVPAPARDLAHLDALRLRLSHERARLAAARTDRERAARAVTVAQAEREVAGELRFLGIADTPAEELSDDELAAALAEG